jgi:molybdopterin converting factor small subunit
MAVGSTVKIYLFGGLDRWTSHGDVTEVDAKVGDVAGLLRALELPDELVGKTLVNGRRASLDAQVKPGDEIALFPPIREDPDEDTCVSGSDGVSGSGE